jgi:hypothetical protein
MCVHRLSKIKSPGPSGGLWCSLPMITGRLRVFEVFRADLFADEFQTGDSAQPTYCATQTSLVLLNSAQSRDRGSLDDFHI